MKRFLNRPLKFLFFLTILINTGFNTRSQEFDFGKGASRFVNDQDIDSLILLRSIPLAGSKGISPKDFKLRYPAYRNRYNEFLKATLQNPFLRLEKKYKDVSFEEDNPKFQQVRQEYLKEIDHAISLALENSSIFYPLFEMDLSDRILAFHAHLKVGTNGEIEVKEIIRIYNGNGQTGSTAHSGNDDIKRGITRDIPTRYSDRNGFNSTTGFKLISVFKNGRPEPYETESLSNGYRIRIGNKEVYLDTGIFVYEIDYRTNHQLIYHPDKDELYWNVNGNGWVFTADTVTCEVEFPSGSEIKETNCYTGPQGSTEHRCYATIHDSRFVFFTGTERFNSYDGLTIAASVDKGVLKEPGKVSKALHFLSDNFILPVLPILVAFFVGFYYYYWKRYGKDPKKGTIIPRFEPPTGISPAGSGYILEQSYTPRQFAAALVEAAVNHHLKIEVSKEGLIFKSVVYHFKSPDNLSPEELSTIKDRYGFTLSRIYGQKAEKGKYNSTLRGLYQNLQTSLEGKFLKRKSNKGKGLFSLNRGYIAIGTLFLIIAFIICGVYLANHFSSTILIFELICMLVMVIAQFVFARIMSAYTREGREITDQILGFKMYLGTAEQPVYNQMAPPEKTLQLFEAFLPYAIALGVENAWADKFDTILQKAIEDGYQPGYYSSLGGFGSGFNLSSMSQGIASGLSSTISSASTPPSSSSGGSSGGGSSGGGGGGGGGGGW